MALPKLPTATSSTTSQTTFEETSSLTGTTLETKTTTGAGKILSLTTKGTTTTTNTQDTTSSSSSSYTTPVLQIPHGNSKNPYIIDEKFVGGTFYIILVPILCGIILIYLLTMLYLRFKSSQEAKRNAEYMGLSTVKKANFFKTGGLNSCNDNDLNNGFLNEKNNYSTDTFFSNESIKKGGHNKHNSKFSNDNDLELDDEKWLYSTNFARDGLSNQTVFQSPIYNHKKSKSFGSKSVLTLDNFTNDEKLALDSSFTNQQQQTGNTYQHQSNSSYGGLGIGGAYSFGGANTNSNTGGHRRSGSIDLLNSSNLDLEAASAIDFTKLNYKFGGEGDHDNEGGIIDDYFENNDDSVIINPQYSTKKNNNNADTTNPFEYVGDGTSTMHLNITQQDLINNSTILPPEDSNYDESFALIEEPSKAAKQSAVSNKKHFHKKTLSSHILDEFISTGELPVFDESNNNIKVNNEADMSMSGNNSMYQDMDPVYRSRSNSPVRDRSPLPRSPINRSRHTSPVRNSPARQSRQSRNLYNPFN
ncbi:unnamed protein product [[Candida] boidinii]|uniref:Unnamed protein product n=1 Tax=Candida boidinii TaxID=5477 RepID=A0A9W6WJW1_CANBO|nr:hypothetical protein B5S30_g3770 [[Candida] boidinii]GME78159.1 unnamed protein product [[Candida] boidinii]GMF97653.1 unnamed protein product [[Candida] boidinii]